MMEEFKESKTSAMNESEIMCQNIIISKTSSAEETNENGTRVWSTTFKFEELGLGSMKISDAEKLCKNLSMELQVNIEPKGYHTCSGVDGNGVNGSSVNGSDGKRHSCNTGDKKYCCDVSNMSVDKKYCECECEWILVYWVSDYQNIQTSTCE